MLKNGRIPLAALFTLLYPLSLAGQSAQCPMFTTSLSLNTGVDAANASLPGGSPDLHWTVIEDPFSSTVEPRPANVLIDPHPAWATIPQSRWISSQASSSQGTNGDYFYKSCFCLRDGFSNPSLKIDQRADDEADVFLNNTLAQIQSTTTPPAPILHGAASSFLSTRNSDHLVYPGPFKVGENCLIVRVKNTGGQVTGLDLVGSITAAGPNGAGSGVLKPECCNPTGSICGMKWHDRNQDGVRQPAEPGLPNWLIQLSNGQTAVTDQFGNYCFSNLAPGGYTVTEQAQAGWVQTLPKGSGSYSVSVGAATVAGGLDFGNCNNCEPTGCCPGPNLIQNGNFEAGNSGFSSSYLFVPNPNSAGAVPPGRYSVLNSTQASTVASTWNVKSSTSCSATGKFLTANGATGQSGSKKVWGATVGVVPGKEYRFCANLRNMPQCAFDVKPKVELRFTSPANTTAPSVISANPSNACDWVLESRSILIPGGTTSLTSEVWLDETGLGDGNDLALDGLSLQEMTQANASFVLLNIASSNITASSYNITATPVSGQPYSFYWEVCEVDSNGNCIASTRVQNPSQWWAPGPNDFKGYVGTSSLVTTNPVPGVFQTQKKYQIKYGVFGLCTSWTESRWYFGFSHSAKKLVVKKSAKDLDLAMD